ncbi:hypothetical protein E3P99_00801 [Wallemia hederae]|uniref:Uncharacterized protein n=1 Tax=Wallemia hederae TaxID=1540922 RepID=A0A4T0FUD1_9BASI|nr:hypothetical protein E3P99_00801 [Wallemia hederae]
MQRSWPANYVLQTPILRKLAVANEDAWLAAAATAEAMNDAERALVSYQNALVHSPYSITALSAVGAIYRHRENFPKAIEFYQRALNVQQDNGDIWSALGHAYLMIDDLQKAYTAYQQALYHLPAPKLQDPKLWYGIGILYDRYGSLEHAEEAFAGVIKIAPDFDKANEIYFRLGIIYKQQHKFATSLECFRYILHSPPKPLSEIDIWFQIGHVYEQQKEFGMAREAYERVLMENPEHAKVLQQLGWLYHQTSSTNSGDQELAIQYLTKSLGVDPTDPQSWYLLGRAYMAGQKFNKAYEAYQQAVYRDGRNPTFWCSIGVLYYQINQYRDALDAYSRAIRLNPYISEVWFDLGSLYESCHNQISDAIDAYARAADLDPSNPHIKQRLQLLKNVQANGGSVPAAPVPQDVHPTAYAQPQAVSSSAANSDGGVLEGADSMQQQQQQQQRMMQAHARSQDAEMDGQPVAVGQGQPQQPIQYAAPPGLPSRHLTYQRNSPVPVVEMQRGMREQPPPPPPQQQQQQQQQYVSYAPAHYDDGRPVVDWEGRPVSVQRYHSPVPNESRRNSGAMLSPPNSHPPHLSQPYERSVSVVNGGGPRNARYDPRMDITTHSQPHPQTLPHALPHSHSQPPPVIANARQESPPRVTPAKGGRGRKSVYGTVSAANAQKMEDAAAYTPPPSESNLQIPQPRRPAPRARQSVYVGAGMESPRKQAMRAQQQQAQHVHMQAQANAQAHAHAQASTSAMYNNNNGRYSHSHSQSQSPQSEDDGGAGAVPPVARVVDEDYDEGAADALMGLAGAAAASDRMGGSRSGSISGAPNANANINTNASSNAQTPHHLPSISVPPSIRGIEPEADGTDEMARRGSLGKRNNGDVHDAPNKRMREGESDADDRNDRNGAQQLSSPETDPAAFPRKHSMNTMNNAASSPDDRERDREHEHDDREAMRQSPGTGAGAEQKPAELHQQHQQHIPDHEMKDAQ